MTVKYTEDHEWLKIEATSPPSASPCTRRTRWATWCLWTCPPWAPPSPRETAGVVESVKAAADVYMPVSGEVTDQRSAEGRPVARQQRPHGRRLVLQDQAVKDHSQLDALMDEPDYPLHRVRRLIFLRLIPADSFFDLLLQSLTRDPTC
jgi:glycine cleavage system H protein